MARADDETRRTAAELFGRGTSRAETARRLGVSRATAGRWFRAWEAGGAAALTSPTARGRPPRLSAGDLETVQSALTRPPRASGFPLERWSLAAVAALVQRATGVTYHPRHVARVLRRAGWVVPPFGAFAPQAFRLHAHADPDGNALLFRREPGQDPRVRRMASVRPHDPLYRA